MKSALVVAALLLLPVAARAQGPVAPLSVEPMPWLVIDARAGWPAIGEDEVTAAALGRPAIDLPSRAMTGVLGVHAYPIRRGRLKVGIGAELLRGRGRLQKKDSEGEPVDEQITRTLDSVTWQLSLNFGRGQGWSYITAGSGLFAFDSFEGEGPGDAPGRTTLNFGAGARWFKWRHVAFTADLRFYLTKDAEGGEISAPRGPQRIVVLSAGFSIK
jgi:hypothetical protein